MKYLHKISALLGLFLIFSMITVVNYQTEVTHTQKAAISLMQPALKEAILKGFQKGEVAILYPYFDELISICINDKEEIYLAYNAQAALQNFFDQNPPAKFKISHSGKSRGGKENYFIGDYTDKNDQKSRIYIFVETGLIQEIEISSQVVSS